MGLAHTHAAMMQQCWDSPSRCRPGAAPRAGPACWPAPAATLPPASPPAGAPSTPPHSPATATCTGALADGPIMTVIHRDSWKWDLTVCTWHWPTCCMWQRAPVGAVDDPDEAVGGFEVVAPIGAQRLLTAHVPDVQPVPAAPLQTQYRCSGCMIRLKREAARLLQAQTPCQTPHLLYCIVLMLKPSVGLMVDVSSPFMRFTMVVLPALSRPLHGPQQTYLCTIGCA